MQQPEPESTIVQTPEQQERVASELSDAFAVPGFTIERELGRGGMGVVYQATQAGLNRTVALKMVIAGPYADPTARARFLVEAEAVAALEHPHVVRVFQFGEHRGFPYLAMEYVGGGTLSDRIKKGGPFAPRAAAELLVKLADAVAHAHARGVIHRDIKPLNVLLTTDGEPRLTDFGLAKVGLAGHDLSVTGQVLGTPAYMSPEQAAGKVREIGPPADIYSLGATLYDLLTGRPPFVGDSAAVTLVQVLTAEPERPRALNPNVPTELEAICLQCLHREPAARYPSVDALVADLNNFLAARPVMALPAPDHGRPKIGFATLLATRANDPEPPAIRAQTRWLRILLGGALLGAVVAGGIAFFAQPPVEMSDTKAPDESKEVVPEPKAKVQPSLSAQVWKSQALYRSGSLIGWAPGPDGQDWAIDYDAEKVPVLTGTGQVVRQFDPPEAFKVSFNLDPFEATSVDVIVAASEAPGAVRWLFRIDRPAQTLTRVAFGKRAGSDAFEVQGAAITIERKPGDVPKRPYLDLSYTRANGRIVTLLADKEIGRTPTDAGLKTTELRIDARGGRVRVEDAQLEDLTPPPPPKK